MKQRPRPRSVTVPRIGLLLPLQLLLRLRLGMGAGRATPFGFCLLPRRLLFCLASLRASACCLLLLRGLLTDRRT